jgi:copper(I)-binding protein
VPTVRTRRLTAAALSLTAALTLTACGVGGDAQTSQQYQPGIGANLRTGDVQLYNVLLVASPDDTLALSAGILNTTDSPQRLESVTLSPLDGSATVTAEPSTALTIPARQLLTVGREGELAGIDGQDIPVGRYVDVTLTFADAGEVEISAPVVGRTEAYADVAQRPASGSEQEQGEEGSG